MCTLMAMFSFKVNISLTDIQVLVAPWTTAVNTVQRSATENAMVSGKSVDRTRMIDSF